MVNYTVILAQLNTFYKPLVIISFGYFEYFCHIFCTGVAFYKAKC